MSLALSILTVPVVASLFYVLAVAVAQWQWRRRVSRLPKARVYDFRTYKSARASDVAGRMTHKDRRSL